MSRLATLRGTSSRSGRIAAASGDFPAESGEVAILKCCARTHMDAATAERLAELLRNPVDWARLRNAARRHGLLPLVYEHLCAAGPDLVLSDLLAELREDCLALTRHNLFLTAELCRIQECLETAGIPAIPFKGPALAASVYGNPALRECVDLDFLVPERNVVEAWAVLAGLGYNSRLGSERSQRAARRLGAGQYAFQREDGKSLVELHSERTLRYFPLPPDLGQFRERCGRVELSGQAVPSLAPTDLLLLLCVHGAKDYWAELKWICDVAELLAAEPAMDWDEVLEQSRRLRSQRMVFLGLRLASELLDAPLPEEVAGRLRAEPGVEWLAGQVRRALFDEADSLAGLGRRFLFRMRMCGNAWERVRYGLRFATAPAQEDYASVALPAPLFPLYWVVRPMRMSVESAAGAWRRASGVRGRPEPALRGAPESEPASTTPGVCPPGSTMRREPHLRWASLRVLAAPDVLLQTVEGESVLLSLKHESYFGLDTTGTGMWGALTTADSLEAAYRVLLAQYDVDPRRLRQDLERFVEALVHEELVELRAG